MQTEILFERIKALPPEKIAEVVDFVEFLWFKSVPTVKFSVIDNRAAELKSIVESMMNNTFSGNPSHFSREELHERR